MRSQLEGTHFGGGDGGAGGGSADGSAGGSDGRAGRGSGLGAGGGLAILLLAAALAVAPFYSNTAWAQQAPGANAAQESPMGPGIAIPRETLVLRWQDGRLWVLDLVTVTNAGNTAVSEVQLPLVPGAQGVTFDGDELEIAEDSAWDRRPLAPGESRRYTLQYYVMIFRWPHPLHKPIVHPTAELTVMAMPEEIVVGGLDLERGPAQMVAGQSLDVWASSWLAPGVPWQVIVRPGTHAGPVAGWNGGLLDLPVLAELDRFPGDWLVQRAARNPQGALIVLVVALLVGAGAMISLKKEREKGSGQEPKGQRPISGRSRRGDTPVQKGLDAEIGALVHAVARLDVAFEENSLTERAYRRRRQRLMRRLVRKARSFGADRLDRLFER